MIHLKEAVPGVYDVTSNDEESCHLLQTEDDSESSREFERPLLRQRCFLFVCLICLFVNKSLTSLLTQIPNMNMHGTLLTLQVVGVHVPARAMGPPSLTERKNGIIEEVG